MSEENAVDMDELKANVQKALEAEDAKEEEVLDDERVEDEEDDEQYSEAEQRAMEMGWNPDPESLKDTGKEWVPAEEFLRNQKWVDEIKGLKKTLNKTKRVVDALKEHNKIVEEKAYEKAIKQLRAQKKEAAEEADVAKMLEIDEQIEEVSRKKQENKAAAAAEHTKEDWDEAYEIFVDENPWYKDNPKMRKYADTIGWSYVQQNPGVAPEDVYEHVIKEVKDTFEQEQKPAKSKRKPDVTPASRSGSGKGGKAKHTVNDIPEEHRHIAVTLIKSGEISEEDYLKQYFPEDYS